MRPRFAATTVVCAIVLSVAVSSAAARTYVTNGYPPTPVSRPSAFVAGSGVGGGVIDLTNMRWSHWGTRSAVGHGTLRYNTCDPDCASGNLKSASAKVRLYRRRAHCRIPGPNGATVTSRVALFTKIAVTYNGHVWRSLAADTQQCQ